MRYCFKSLVIFSVDSSSYCNLCNITHPLDSIKLYCKLTGIWKRGKQWLGTFWLGCRFKENQLWHSCCLQSTPMRQTEKEAKAHTERHHELMWCIHGHGGPARCGWEGSPGLDFRWVSCGRLVLKRKGEERNIINTSGVTVSSWNEKWQKREPNGRAKRESWKRLSRTI